MCFKDGQQLLQHMVDICIRKMCAKSNKYNVIEMEHTRHFLIDKTIDQLNWSLKGLSIIFSPIYFLQYNHYALCIAILKTKKIKLYDSLHGSYDHNKYMSIFL
nr:unnamed protein product [Meloidogyne enterolobii]